MRLEISDHAKSNIQADGAYTIKNSKKMFILLSSKLYANPIRAIVREISTNATDAHILSKTPDKPFKVSLPSRLRATFVVRDFGPGLTDDQIREIYTTYGESTKDDSDDFNGAMGLGSKSPFGYTNTYTVGSYLNGKKTTYTMFMLDGEPKFTKGEVTDTPNEPNGLEVMVPVKAEDIERFTQEAVSVLNAFDVKPLINEMPFEGFLRTIRSGMVIDRKRIDMKGVDIETIGTNDWRLLGMPHMGVWMANVVYPINEKLLEESMANDRSIGPETAAHLCKTAFSHIKSVLGGTTTSIQFRVPTGTVGFTPNREELQYDRKTVRYMASMLAGVLDDLTGTVTELLDKAEKLKNPIDGIKLLRTHPLWNAVSANRVDDAAIPTYNLMSPTVANIIGNDLLVRVKALVTRYETEWESRYGFGSRAGVSASGVRVTSGSLLSYHPRICVQKNHDVRVMRQVRKQLSRGWSIGNDHSYAANELAHKLIVALDLPRPHGPDVHSWANGWSSSTGHMLSDMLGKKPDSLTMELRSAVSSATSSAHKDTGAVPSVRMDALKRAQHDLIISSRTVLLSTDESRIMLPNHLIVALLNGANNIHIIEQKTKVYSESLRTRIASEAKSDAVGSYVLFTHGPKSGERLRADITEQLQYAGATVPALPVHDADRLFDEYKKSYQARRKLMLDEANVRLYTPYARSGDTTRIEYGDIGRNHFLPDFVFPLSDEPYGPLETTVTIRGKKYKMPIIAAQDLLIAMSRLKLNTMRKGKNADFKEKSIEECKYGRTHIGIIVARAKDLTTLRNKGLDLPLFQDWLNKMVAEMDKLSTKQNTIDALIEYNYSHTRVHSNKVTPMETQATWKGFVAIAKELSASKVPAHMDAYSLFSRAVAAVQNSSGESIVSTPVNNGVQLAQHLLAMIDIPNVNWTDSLARQLYRKYPLVTHITQDNAGNWTPGCKQHVLKYIEMVATMTDEEQVPDKKPVKETPKEI